MADGRSFLDGLQAGRPLAPGVVAVIGCLRAGRHDEGVVYKGRTVPQDDAFHVRINVNRFSEQDAGIFLPAQDTAERSGDFAGRERACGDLI